MIISISTILIISLIIISITIILTISLIISISTILIINMMIISISTILTISLIISNSSQGRLVWQTQKDFCFGQVVVFLHSLFTIHILLSDLYLILLQFRCYVLILRCTPSLASAFFLLLFKVSYLCLFNIWLTHLLYSIPFQVDMLHALWILDVNKILNSGISTLATSVALPSSSP